MILNIFKKYSEKSKRKKIIITIIQNLNINEKQKNLYLDSLEFLDEIGLDKLYKSLESFMGEIERQQMEDISRESFTKIAGMRKKEVQEKQKEINSFGFLLNNL
ncbi:MAG: hypothetical protein PHE25_00095 [Candidatus Gracilibacteria bacterium]|nr:hypothetical protein [Candidatus Gracilibacteria bacterium]